MKNKGTTSLFAALAIMLILIAVNASSAVADETASTPAPAGRCRNPGQQASSTVIMPKKNGR